MIFATDLFVASDPKVIKRFYRIILLPANSTIKSYIAFLANLDTIVKKNR